MWLMFAAQMTVVFVGLPLYHYIALTYIITPVFLGHTSTWAFCRHAFGLLEDAACSPDTDRAPLNLDGTAFRLHWQPKSKVDPSDLLQLPPVDHAIFLFNTVKFRFGELFTIVDETLFFQKFDEFHKDPLETAQTHVLWFVEYLIILAFGKAFASSSPTRKNNAPSGREFAARALSLPPDIAFLQDERPAMLAIEVLTLIALYFRSIDMRSPAYQYVSIDSKEQIYTAGLTSRKDWPSSPSCTP